MKAWTFFSFGAFFLFSIIFYNIALGELVVSASGGTVLADASSADPDDGITVINSGSTFTGKYYGQTVGAISVANNGNLNFATGGASGLWFPQGFIREGNSVYDSFPSYYIARIAPLWDDIILFQNSHRIVNSTVAGSYLAVTWENVVLFNDAPAGPVTTPPPSQTFQAVWFEQSTTIRGYSFQADDIAFGYQGSTAGTNSFGNLFATVGVSNGLNAFTPLPGDASEPSSPAGDGFIRSIDNQSNLLAWETDAFLLFRPKTVASDGYTSTKEFFPLTAVPEPSTAGTIALGVLVLNRCFRRRRI